MALRTMTADRGDAGRRIDLVLRRHLTDIPSATRTRVQAWIENGLVTVNGAPIHRVSSRAAWGDAIAVAVPSGAEAAPRRTMAAEDIPLHVRFEDEHLLVVDKPAGMVVHPTFRHPTGTLMHALLWRARDWPPGQRPSLVGRLDKLTSGLVLVAKTTAVHAALQRATASADAEKEYLAVVYGRVNVARGEIDLRLSRDTRDRRRVVASAEAGAASLTRFERLARVSAPRVGLALLSCRLVTGRMHQIRVHLAARGWPLVGDPTYGTPGWTRIANPSLAAALRTFPRQALHAWRLAFRHPATGQRLTTDAPVPRDLDELLTAAGLAERFRVATARRRS